MNLRPSGYEPDELPDCSTPRQLPKRLPDLDPIRQDARKHIPLRHQTVETPGPCGKPFCGFCNAFDGSPGATSGIAAGNPEPLTIHAAPSRGHPQRKDAVPRISALGRLGSVLLSHALRRSTIGAEEFNGRVRNGIGFWAPRYNHQAGETRGLSDLAGHFPAGIPSSSERAWVMRVIKSIELLGPVSFIHCCTSTPGLSTWSSSTALMGRTGFEEGFPLRCFQRLSRPHIATLLCRWRDNRSTRGASIPVLSY